MVLQSDFTCNLGLTFYNSNMKHEDWMFQVMYWALTNMWLILYVLFASKSLVSQITIVELIEYIIPGKSTQVEATENLLM